MTANLVLLIAAVCGAIALVLIVMQVLDHFRNKRVEDQQIRYNESVQHDWKQRAQSLVNDTHVIIGKAKRGGVVAQELALQFAEDQSWSSGVQVEDSFRVPLFDLRVNVAEAAKREKEREERLQILAVTEAGRGLPAAPVVSAVPVLPASSMPALPAVAVPDLDQDLEVRIVATLRGAKVKEQLVAALESAKAFCHARPQLAAKLADTLLQYDIKVLIANA